MFAAYTCAPARIMTSIIKAAVKIPVILDFFIILIPLPPISSFHCDCECHDLPGRRLVIGVACRLDTLSLLAPDHFHLDITHRLQLISQVLDVVIDRRLDFDGISDGHRTEH